MNIEPAEIHATWATVGGETGAVIFPSIEPPQLAPHYTEGDYISLIDGRKLDGPTMIEPFTREGDKFSHAIVTVKTTANGAGDHYMFGTEDALRMYLTQPENVHILAMLRRIVTEETSHA